MTRSNVVISYSRFLERQERRREILSELALRDQLRTIETDVVPAPNETAIPQRSGQPTFTPSVEVSACEHDR